MNDCPQSKKCDFWVHENRECSSPWLIARGWTLDCAEIQESRCPDFEKIKKNPLIFGESQRAYDSSLDTICDEHEEYFLMDTLDPMFQEEEP